MATAMAPCQRPGLSLVLAVSSRLSLAARAFPARPFPRYCKSSSTFVTTSRFRELGGVRRCGVNLPRAFAGSNQFCTASVGTAPVAEEMAAKETPKEIFLKDYKPTDYHFDTVDLKFVLTEQKTSVVSNIRVIPKSSSESPPLVLDGRDVKLLHVKINGQNLNLEEVEVTSRHLTLKSLPVEPFNLEIGSEIHPETNLSLEGLYKSSSGMFCTQCEAEGFRKITFYQDRPDVMAKFTTRIEADKEQYPVLLSNGNLIDSGDLENGFHYAVWEDPFKKPCYLFALVAGQLTSRDDTFKTRSARDVKLRIWTPAQDVAKTEHAMHALKLSMKWDEDVYGLEYDLDLFNIVVVPDFNMGAMENKSLNIFNSKLVLASPETATDVDYAAILGVIGHEYFHNWTGNRVTCRDWFQLSLKEGLTVFRDQEFSSDMGSRPVKRIGDVALLRTAQFSEDAGPMAHPVRPHSYIKMDNFYTVTVYEKGAEVVRMYQTLLGRDGFRKGMDLYFKRHDGQAVTCEDFFAAMRDANSANLSVFLRWYSQGGTPVLTVSTKYNADARSFTVTCNQEVPPTPGQPVKEPMLIPLAVGLLNSKGEDMLLTDFSDGESLKSLKDTAGRPVKTAVLLVDKEEQEFTFSNIPEKPVPSILRNFSAPVRLVVPTVTDEDLLFLLAHDSDEFNRWEAGQTMGRKLMLDLVQKAQKNEQLSVPYAYVEGIRSTLKDPSLDKEFIAKAITPPGESELMDLMEVADPDAVHTVRKFVIKELASLLKEDLLKTVAANGSSDPYTFDHKNKARRSLKNTALGYLCALDEPETTELALKEYKNATNMTDQMAALAALCQNPGDVRDEALANFYEQWKDEPLVVNKWLALQAMSDIPGNVAKVRKLLDHPSFDMKNPNKVYSLIGAFCRTGINFHAKDGSGYDFLAEVTLQLDKMNPQVASRMVSAFSRWKRFDEGRQSLAKAQLERIVKAEGLSENVFEIASKSLV